MNIAQDFFREVLSEYYDQDFDEVISQFAEDSDLMAFNLMEPKNDEELENLKNLAKVHSLGALLAAMTYLEKQTFKFGESVGLGDELKRRPPWHIMSPRYLEKFGVDIPDDLSRRMHETRKIRNMAAHGRGEPTKEDVDNAISAIEKFELVLSKLDLNLVREKVRQYIEDKYEDQS